MRYVIILSTIKKGKIQNMKMLMRILLYCVGLMFLAFGVAFSVNSNLGVSPVNSLPYVISLILKVDLGRCIIGVFVTYMIVQIIIKRKDYKWINLTQLIFSTIFGYFADFAKGVMHGFVIPTYFGQLLMMAISIVLVAIGVAIYMDVKLVNMPMEGMTLAISDCFPNIEFHKIKIIVDCSSVAVGVVLSFLFMHGLFGIREGTILSALLAGKLLPVVKKKISPVIQKLCF